jgi:hypothetical protein
LAMFNCFIDFSLFVTNVLQSYMLKYMLPSIGKMNGKFVRNMNIIVFLKIGPIQQLRRFEFLYKDILASVSIKHIVPRIVESILYSTLITTSSVIGGYKKKTVVRYAMIYLS